MSISIEELVHPKKPDPLFAYIEKVQDGAPWGSVLDAGTGNQSLKWISGLNSESWAAITGDEGRKQNLLVKFDDKIRPCDRIICGNWSDPDLLAGEKFDVVIADYLLGALEGYSPYYQDCLFPRLKQHVGHRLYVVGLEPYADSSPLPWGQLIIDMARLRDAALLISGRRPYREYPLDWTVRNLEAAGFEVDQSWVFPIVYNDKFVDGQLKMCERFLHQIKDPTLAQNMKDAIARFRERMFELYERDKNRVFGANYVACARIPLNAS